MIPDSTLPSLLKLAERISRAQLQAETRAKATHERFNVFSTLLQEHDEVRLHTRFLHCLLDPEGSHDCGSLFLDLLFATLSKLHPITEEKASPGFAVPASVAQWTVRKEASCPPHGQIDLLLERPGFGIAVENKIHAYEQGDQLFRYAQYLRKHGDGARVIYLTLCGKESFTHGGKAYLRISYAEDILAWLEKCLQATYHIIPVNQVILQYREVVRRLTGKTMNTSDMKNATDFIALHPDIIRHRQQIIAAIGAARANYLDTLASGIMEHFKSKGYFVALKEGMKESRFGANDDGAIIITPRNDSPLHPTPFKIWVEKWFDNCLMVGIKVTNGGYKKQLSAADQLIVEKMNLQLNQKEESQEFRRSSINEAWPTGWHELIKPFDDNQLAVLMEKQDLPGTISKFCDGIECHIRQLEEAYLEASKPVVAV